MGIAEWGWHQLFLEIKEVNILDEGPVEVYILSYKIQEHCCECAAARNKSLDINNQPKDSA